MNHELRPLTSAEPTPEDVGAVGPDYVEKGLQSLPPKLAAAIRGHIAENKEGHPPHIQHNKPGGLQRIRSPKSWKEPGAHDIKKNQLPPRDRE